MMTEKDFCSLELTHELFEIGYPVYHYDNTPIDKALAYANVTLYEAHKFLRKEKEICVEVYACAGGFMWELCKPFRTDSFSGGTTIYVTDNEDNPKLNDCGKFDEWEDALEDGIRVAVKVVKERENK